MTDYNIVVLVYNGEKNLEKCIIWHYINWIIHTLYAVIYIVNLSIF